MRSRWTGLTALTMSAAVWAGPIQAAQVVENPQSSALVRQGRGPVPTIVVSNDENAERTRQELTRIFERYPPALGNVLKLDPSLLSNPTYVSAYPALTAFLSQHPEVTRNPSYFLAYVPTVQDNNRPVRDGQASRIVQEALTGLAVLTALFMGFMCLGWLVKTLVDYRRWNRLSRVQAEAHTKLLDRFSANSELIAYVQSPAGAQFLQSAPIALDPGARKLGAPLTRILWSIQAGLVLLSGGFGMQIVSAKVTDVDAQQALYGIGMLSVAIGVGFVLSAGVAYLLSRKLGLFDAAEKQSQLTTNN